MTIENFKMPAGRIVGGNPTAFENAIDFYTRQQKLDKNGQPVKEHRIDLAVPKAEFLQNVWPYIVQEVAKVYPQYANAHPDQLNMTRFAWKIINGDSPECPQGSSVPYNTREGYPGNYIIKIRTSAFCPSTYKFENGAYRKVEENEIRTGDYVVTSLNISVHKEKDGGIYWNPNAYELVGYGQVIKGSQGGDPMKLFGGQASALPMGASATPISAAPVTAQMPGTVVGTAPMSPMTPQAMPMAQPAPVAPQPVMPVAPAAPQAMPAPAYDFLANAGMPQAQPAPVAPQPVQGQPFNNILQDRINY